MTLSFRTHWPKHMGEWAGKPTFFVEKTTNCLKDILGEHLPVKYKPENYNFVAALDLDKKLHSIREDKPNLWGAESNIHFVINNRTPDRFQFAPVVKCVSVQEVFIHPDQHKYRYVAIGDGGTLLTGEDLEQFAINDGFESADQFFAWFNTDFTGKIIHWTDLKY